MASGANSEPTPGPVFDEASSGPAKGDAEYRRWRPGRRIAKNGPPVRVARKQKGLIRRMMNAERRNSARPTACRSLAREHSGLLGTYVCTDQGARNTSTSRHQQGAGPLFTPAATRMRLRPTEAILLLVMLCRGSVASSGGFARHDVLPPEGHRFSADWRIVWSKQNDDELTDLIALSPDNAFHLYRQTPEGFPSAPSITLNLAPSAVWFALADVCPDNHLELVYGAEGGIYAVPLIAGAPPQQPKLLAPAPQVIDGSAAGAPPVYLENASYGLGLPSGVDAFPILETDAVRFWMPPHGALPAAIPLTHRAALPAEGALAPWGTAAGPAHRMATMEWGNLPERPAAVNQWPDDVRERLPGLRKRYKESKGSLYFSLNDAGGDTQEDLIVYSYRWGLDPKTMIIAFVRDAEGALPETPTYVLRSRGIPIEWNFSKRKGFKSPFYDVNGDGLKDIVMIEMKNKPVASRSFVEALLTEGVDWNVTVRLRQPGHPFRSRPDVKFPIVGLPPAFDEDGAMAIVGSDFTGDGRPDLLIRRTLSKMQLYGSRSDRLLFDRKPQLTVEVPAHGPKFVTDLNGDRVADLYLTDTANGQIILYLSR